MSRVQDRKQDRKQDGKQDIKNIGGYVDEPLSDFVSKLTRFLPSSWTNNKTLLYNVVADGDKKMIYNTDYDQYVHSIFHEMRIRDNDFPKTIYHIIDNFLPGFLEKYMKRPCFIPSIRESYKHDEDEDGTEMYYIPDTDAAWKKTSLQSTIDEFYKTLTVCASEAKQKHCLGFIEVSVTHPGNRHAEIIVYESFDGINFNIYFYDPHGVSETFSKSAIQVFLNQLKQHPKLRLYDARARPHAGLQTYARDRTGFCQMFTFLWVCSIFYVVYWYQAQNKPLPEIGVWMYDVETFYKRNFAQGKSHNINKLVVVFTEHMFNTAVTVAGKTQVDADRMDITDYEDSDRQVGLHSSPAELKKAKTEENKLKKAGADGQMIGDDCKTNKDCLSGCCVKNPTGKYCDLARHCKRPAKRKQ